MTQPLDTFLASIMEYLRLNGLPTLLLLMLSLFIDRKVWPFLTTEVWVSWVKWQATQQQMLGAIQQSTAQTSELLNIIHIDIRTHDEWARDVAFNRETDLKAISPLSLFPEQPPPKKRPKRLSGSEL